MKMITRRAKRIYDRQNINIFIKSVRLIFHLVMGAVQFPSGEKHPSHNVLNKHISSPILLSSVSTNKSAILGAPVFANYERKTTIAGNLSTCAPL